MNLDLWSIFIIVVAFQGLFLLSVILFSADKRIKKGSPFLVSIVLVLIWFLVEFFFIRNKINFQLSIFYGTRYGSWFLLGPLTYFYFRSITNADWKFSRKHLLHFLPFVLFVIIIPLFAYRILDNRQIDYGMLSVFDHREKSLTTIQWMYSLVFVAQFMHLAFFLFKNLKVVTGYSRGLSNEYSTIDDKVKWLKYFNIALIVLLVLSAIFLYLLLITDIYRRHLDYIYVLPIGILFYFISFKFMRTEWQSAPKNGNSEKYAKSSLKPSNVDDSIKRIKALMDQDKLFLNPKLRLGDLAEHLSISKHHISQILNQEFQQSFYDFVNQHRVVEAKQLINENTDHKLLQIAYDSGFNNKTSFVNAFKKFEGITPSKYREGIHS